MLITLKLSTGKEIELTISELQELYQMKDFFNNSYPYPTYPPYPIITYQPPIEYKPTCSYKVD